MVTVTYTCPRCGAVVELERGAYLADKCVTPHPVEGWSYVPAYEVDPETTSDDAADLAGEGVGVEPASAASIAGLRKLRREGVVDADEEVVCLTTGHLLKDPKAAAEAGEDPEPVPGTTEGVLERLESN